MRNNEKVWVFVSHSNRDLETVRRVRNALEEAGGQPILFFLKCVSDHDELDDLIRREIRSRSVFLLCDSPSARESKWVQDEIACVRELTGKIVEELQLDGDWEKQLGAITRLIFRSTVFLSYSRRYDHDLVDSVKRVLLAKGLVVMELGSFVPARMHDLVQRTVDKAMECGSFLQFLSVGASESPYLIAEGEGVISRDESRYLPIALDSINSLRGHLPESISSRPMIDGSSRDPIAIASLILDAL